MYKYFILAHSLMYLHADYLLIFEADVEFDELDVVQHHVLWNYLIYLLIVVESLEQLLIVVAFEF